MCISYENIRVKISELPESYLIHEIKQYFNGECAEKLIYDNTWYELVYDAPRSAEYFCLTAKVEPSIEGIKYPCFIVKPKIELKYKNLDRRISLCTYNFNEIRTMWEYIKMFKNQKY